MTNMTRERGRMKSMRGKVTKRKERKKCTREKVMGERMRVTEELLGKEV